MQKQFRYIYNNEEVSREDFEKLAGDSFKWFEGDSIVSVPFSSFDSFFTGDFKSRRQINDHLDSVLNIYQNKVTEDIINKPKCSPQCFCDGSCKKEIKEPFSIQVPKPTPFNKVNFFDKIEQERQLRESFERRVKELDKKEGVKESQSVKKAPIFTYCKVNSLALEALAFRALYGHEKYKESDFDWQNFLRVANAEEEYSNAMLRHALNIGEDETEEQHLIASAWNAVARLEIFLRNKKKNLHNSK